MGRFFSFPNPVNDISARLVAGGVVLMSVAAIALSSQALMCVIALGFLARVLTGPKASVLGQLATRLLTPWVERLTGPGRRVAGPPKRFAQGIGLFVSTTAVVLALGFHNLSAARAVLALLVLAASLESFAGVCLGCYLFAGLMKLGVIPESVCAECADIWTVRRPSTSSTK